MRGHRLALRPIIALLAALVVMLSSAACDPQPAGEADVHTPVPVEADATTTAVEVNVTRVPVEADHTQPPVEINVTRAPVEAGRTGSICAPEVDRPKWLFRDFVQWTPDGSTVLFTDGSHIYAVAADGSRLWNVVAPKPPEGQREWPMVPFSIAPDGEHLVYATCDFGGSYELARVRVDGKGIQRVTRNLRGFDSHPAWSPDGARIAFLAADFDVDGSTGDYPSGIRPRLYTRAPDGADLTELPVGTVDPWTHLDLVPPQWSPDSQQLAFVKREGVTALYTVAVEGGAPQRLSDAVSGPSWSPDGTRIAFAKPDSDEVALYTIAADGSDAQRVTAITGWQPQYGTAEPSRAWIETVAWSPDGSKILYACGGICVVDLNGTPVSGAPLNGTLAAWSPDGSRIALHGSYPPVHTVAPDGSDLRLLVLWHEKDGLRAARAPRPPAGPVDVAGCAAGTAVPKPADNPGLVQDCETLLVVQAKLAGVGGLGWTTDRPLKEWDGVFLGDPRLGVYRPPLRVRRLVLHGLGLRGVIPPELARLTQLSWLLLGNNSLAGDIPSTLGALSELKILNLSRNQLSRAIPPELGTLTKLDVLDLSQNFLSGAIPPELGTLRELNGLNLSGNYLIGTVPPDLGSLPGLKHLDLASNSLTGCIPPALRRIPDNDLVNLELPDCEQA